MKGMLFVLSLLCLVVLFLPADVPAGQRTDCDKTYIIKPTGMLLTTPVKLTELSAKALTEVEGKEALKYGNVKFQPTKEPATRQVNCAGYVLAKLLPGQIPPSIVVTTDFYNKFIVPFKQPSGTIKAGDVVVYSANGSPNHIALVAGPPVDISSEGVHKIPILTKDGDERPYHGFALYGNPHSPGTFDDPLIKAHAPVEQRGAVEIFTLDVSNVRIEPLYSGPCDPLSSGKYVVTVNNAGTEHVADWHIKVAENKIEGKSFWRGFSGEDRLWGTIEGNKVVIERDCRTVSKLEKCHQVYEGVIGATTIDGSWSGTGKRPTGSITWTLELN